MRRLAALLLIASASGEAQQPVAKSLRGVLGSGDSAALIAAVRQRPADARETLGRLITEAGQARIHGDSLLAVARRLARTYTEVWQDSFPVLNLARFERLSPRQRAAKVTADSIRLAGNAAHGKLGITAAMKLWRDAARRSLAVPDSAGAAAAYGNIGSGFYENSELDSAAFYLAHAQRIAEAFGDRRTTLNAMGVLGNIALARGELRRAQETLSRTLEQRMRFGDVRGAVADQTNLGLIAADLDDPTNARRHFDAAIRLARQHDLDEGLATALLNLANLASAEGLYPAAIGAYREALGLYQSLDDEANAALVLHNLGLLALRRGDYGAARVHLLDALAVFSRIGTVEDKLQVRRDLATLNAAAGDLQGALVHLRRAEQLLATVPGRYDLAAAFALARADLGVQLNTLTQADRDFARAQALFRRGNDAQGESEAQQGRALLLVERRQYARALEELRLVHRRQAAAEDRRPAALTLLLIAHTQALQDSFTAARATAERARDTLRAIGDVVGEATANMTLGDLEFGRGSPLAAEALFREGLARIRGRGVPTLSVQLHVGLARALRARGAASEAATALRLAIADVERMASSIALDERRSTFLADKWDAYEELALLEQELGHEVAAYTVSEQLRARQMRELLARGRVVPARVSDSTLLAREHDLRTRINELTRQLEVEEKDMSTLRGSELAGAASGVTREALARAQETYGQLLLELRDDNAIAPIIRGDVTPWRTVAARLKPAQALLTYLVGDSTTLVFVVRSDTMRVLDLGMSREALATVVDFARGTMRRPQVAGGTAAWRTPLRRLYTYLIAPIEDAGLLGGIRQLTIVPHGELHYLPFAALMPKSEREEFLIERYDIAYAPSVSAWVQLTERGASTSDRVLALAPRSNQLPGSREEVEAIRALYGHQATVLTNGSATEQAFRATVERYGIVHLATYGVLNQHNPLFSFVDLNRGNGSDGRLEVHEVFGLSLNARLLVLSACQTALASGAVSDVPAGDDWVGLVRAFLGAGAQNVIATLWAVEDRATARVMERLHRRLRAGASEDAALSNAQRETLRNPTTSSPFFWAGFVLVGGR